MSTRIVNRDAIVLGLAEIFISDSATHIANTSQALLSADYFSALAEISFSINRQKLIEHSYSNSIDVVQDVFISKVDFTISVTLLEIYQKTLSYALGGDGGSAELGTTMFTTPDDLRVELVCTYPNKINQLIFIMPRMAVTSDLGFSFSDMEAIKTPLIFTAKRTDNIASGSAWTNFPYGRQIFV